MAKHLYRMRDLRSTKHRGGVIPVAESTIWRWVSEGVFPRPIRMNGVNVWDAETVDEFVRKLFEGGAA